MIHGPGRRGAGAAGRPGCAERAARVDDEVRSIGGSRAARNGPRAREDEEARGGGSRGGVVGGRWRQPSGRDGAG